MDSAIEQQCVSTAKAKNNLKKYFKYLDKKKIFQKSQLTINNYKTTLKTNLLFCLPYYL